MVKGSFVIMAELWNYRMVASMSSLDSVCLKGVD